MKPSKANGYCKSCYDNANNKKRIQGIAKEFIPLTPYNKKIFNLYIKKVLSGYIKNQEPNIAIRLKELLETEEISPIKEWSEVFTLSEKHKIYYNSSKGLKHGCPFHRIRKQLAIKPKTRSYYPIHSLEVLRDKFKDDDYQIICQFSKEKEEANQTKGANAKILRNVGHFHKWCNRESLIKLITKIPLYLESLEHMNLSNYNDHYSSIRIFYRWLLQNQYINSDPFINLTPKKERRKCSSCKQIKNFRDSKSICNTCKAQNKNKDIINKLNHYCPQGSYKKYLWQLYLEYINRFVIKQHHIDITLLFSKYLKENKIDQIKNWNNIKTLSNSFFDFAQVKFKGGCPFEKTGKMLQELGVLSSREQDHSVYYNNSITRLDDDFKTIAEAYFKDLLKARRTLSTCCSLCNLFLHLQKWSSSQYDFSNILKLNEYQIREYLSINSSNETICSLRKFYTWAYERRYLHINPMQNFKTRKINKELTICSNEQINLLFKYIKSKESDPERAMIIALILYWGLTGPELRNSTIEILNGAIHIQLFRDQLSYRNKEYRREQILKLPLEPKWLKDLQMRFISQWEHQYNLIQKSFPRQLLLFSKNLKSNRPIGDEALRIRVYKATQEATGENIHLSALRRTSGHIHSMKGEASILTTLGWSRDYATDFIWRQRKLYSSNKKNLRIQSKVDKIK